MKIAYAITLFLIGLFITYPVYVYAQSNNAHTGAVEISGQFWPGGTVQVTTGTLADEDGLPSFPSNYRFVWHCTPSCPNSQTSKFGDPTYKVKQNELNKKLTLQVQFYDAHGNLESTSTINSKTIDEASGLQGVVPIHLVDGSEEWYGNIRLTTIAPFGLWAIASLAFTLMILWQSPFPVHVNIIAITAFYLISSRLFGINLLTAILITAIGIAVAYFTYNIRR